MPTTELSRMSFNTTGTTGALGSRAESGEGLVDDVEDAPRSGGALVVGKSRTISVWLVNKFVSNLSPTARFRHFGYRVGQHV